MAPIHLFVTTIVIVSPGLTCFCSSQYTSTRMRVIPSSDALLGVDNAPFSSQSRGRARTRIKTPKRKSNLRTPSSKLRSSSATPPPPLSSNTSLPLPPRTAYIPTRPNEELDLILCEPTTPETDLPPSPPSNQMTLMTMTKVEVRACESQRTSQ